MPLRGASAKVYEQVVDDWRGAPGLMPIYNKVNAGGLDFEMELIGGAHITHWSDAGLHFSVMWKDCVDVSRKEFLLWRPLGSAVVEWTTKHNVVTKVTLAALYLATKAGLARVPRVEHVISDELSLITIKTATGVEMRAVRATANQS